NPAPAGPGSGNETRPAAGANPAATRPGAPAGSTNAGAAPGTNATPAAGANNPVVFPEDPPPGPFGAADGLLINGSVNNGAASPFAQSAAFGNTRRGGRSVYNGTVGAILGNSAWDARPYSFSNLQPPK